MRNLKYYESLIVLIITSFAVTTCTLPVRSLPDFNIQIGDPPSGAVVPLAPLEIWADAANNSSNEVTRIAFYANGIWIGSLTTLEHPSPTYPHAASGRVMWTPPAEGEYLLQAQADRRGAVVFSNPVRICVVDFIVDSGYDFSYGYEGPCPIPDRDASARPGAITLAAEATPDSLMYDPAAPPAPRSCPALARASISFQATLVDPPEDVAFVIVSYSMTRPDTSYPEDRTLVLTQTASYAGSTRIYTGSTDNNLVASLRYNYGDVGGDVIWTAKAFGRDGAVLLTDGPYTIPALPCTPVPLSAPFSPSTATPASALDCPAGTYFA